MRIFTNEEVRIIGATYDVLNELGDWRALHESEKDKIIDAVREEME